MVLNLKNPLVFFDLETTGINVSTDHIVELSMVKLSPNGDRATKTQRVNPGVHIPKESSRFHGIYDEDVKDCPTFKQIAKELSKFLEGCDLSGFAVLKFDVPMLVEEFLRAGVEFEIKNRKIIDSQKIFHMMEKRNLASAYKFYCNKTLIDAHSAEADTLASLEILEAQVKQYESQPMVDLKNKQLGVIQNNMGILHDLTNSNLVDLAGRMVRNEKGEELFNFGKHKGQKVTDVLAKEPMYYDWILKGNFPLDTKRKLTEIKLRGFNR
ncbi:MAG: exonuclease domain-containing protein [Cyclobacteriaceae bacterium]